MKTVKSKKPLMMIMIILLFVILAAAFFASTLNADSKTTILYQILEPGELINSITTKGIVLSEHSKNIYSSSGLLIKEILVDVGDKVKKGQVLLKVDTDELVATIKEKKLALSKQSQSFDVNYDNNLRLLQQAKEDLANGTDPTIVNAENKIKTASTNLENARINYNKKVEEFHNDQTSQMLNLEATITNAESALRNAELDYKNKYIEREKIQVLYDSGAVSFEQLQNADIALQNATNKLLDARRILEEAKNIKATSKETLSLEIEKLKQAYNMSKIAYEEALTSKQSAIKTLEQNIQKYQDNVESSKVATKTDADLEAIKTLENKLKKTVVLSPIDGTVTAVLTKEGNHAQGLLFVIEDTSNLKIKTKVKESDYARIKEGMPVKIHSDATGNEEYYGEVSKIAPTTIKDQAGSSNASQVEFEVFIKVLTKDTNLKIGVNAKLDITISKKSDALFVSFDSVITDEFGNSKVYVVEKDYTDEYVAKSKPVKIIQETDFYIEIEGLSKGEKIVKDAAGIKEGMKISPKTK